MDHDDEQAIRTALKEHTDLWIRHDMDEWGTFFTEDSDFITHRGIWWRTRRENVAGHKDAPASVITQKQNYTQTIVDIQEIAPTVALVHTAWTWPDHRLPGADPEDRRGFITLVLVKRDDTWLIRAAHNTRINGLDDFTPA
ncbi:SgcJ/EcaC family oxidoreductase [Nocardia wallacei]|uniref:SgcJ/EcaC family oxidoreductase n=1 Tax=Nocardia wallacei TaxID=480035 RepID=UPI002458A57F|nr:SgcJ/EcaC family oxidoreductase [Nocardia wallacei]